MTTAIAPDEALLGAVLEQVWTTMLRAEPAVLPVEGPAPERTATISVTGDWVAEVAVGTSAHGAEDIARRLLRHAVEVDDEDVDDALGELVNVVAGSLKGALGGSCSLGLPVVTDGPAPGGAPDLLLTLFWDGDPVVVTVRSTSTPR